MRNKIFLSFMIICIFCFILLAAQVNVESGSAGKKIIMASIRKVNSYEGRHLQLIFTEAFKRIGKELVYKYYPVKRASLMADQGKIDGELARVYNYNQKYFNLIRVEEPVAYIRFSAFTTANIKLKGWESLINTNYKVEYVRGTKICEVNLHKVVDNEKLSNITHWSQGLKKLLAGRTDVYVESERTVLDALKTDEFKNSGIHLAGVMEEITIHAFLHIKHKDLVPKLSAVLKEMKEEGLFEKYGKEVFGRYYRIYKKIP